MPEARSYRASILRLASPETGILTDAPSRPECVSGNAENGSQRLESKPSAFKDFMILTDFSRCQHRLIGRLSRGIRIAPAPNKPIGFEDKDYP
jgi:hypothetical protein